jgi:hypothetical protein
MWTVTTAQRKLGLGCPPTIAPTAGPKVAGQAAR